MNPSRRYNGGPIVERSIDLGEPIIYVSMNYRYSGIPSAMRVVNAKYRQAKRYVIQDIVQRSIAHVRSIRVSGREGN